MNGRPTHGAVSPRRTSSYQKPGPAVRSSRATPIDLQPHRPAQRLPAAREGGANAAELPGRHDTRAARIAPNPRKVSLAEPGTILPLIGPGILVGRRKLLS